MADTLTAQDLADTFDAFNRHDIDGVMTHFADDAVFYAVGGPEVYGAKIEGKEAIAAAFVGVWTTMKDAHWEHHSHFVAGSRAVSEWIFSGTNPDGSRVEAEGADLFTVENGKLTVKQALRKNRPVIAANT